MYYLIRGGAASLRHGSWSNSGTDAISSIELCCRSGHGSRSWAASACQSGEGQCVRLVEGFRCGARDIGLHAGAFPIRAGDGVDGAAGGDGDFQVGVHGPAFARMGGAAGGFADDHRAVMAQRVSGGAARGWTVLAPPFTSALVGAGAIRAASGATLFVITAAVVAEPVIARTVVAGSVITEKVVAESVIAGVVIVEGLGPRLLIGVVGVAGMVVVDTAAAPGFCRCMTRPGRRRRHDDSDGSQCQCCRDHGSRHYPRGQACTHVPHKPINLFLRTTREHRVLRTYPRPGLTHFRRNTHIPVPLSAYVLPPPCLISRGRARPRPGCSWSLRR